jgi:hypothetical protein
MLVSTNIRIAHVAPHHIATLFKRCTIVAPHHIAMLHCTIVAPHHFTL